MNESILISAAGCAVSATPQSFESQETHYALMNQISFMKVMVGFEHFLPYREFISFRYFVCCLTFSFTKEALFGNPLILTFCLHVKGGQTALQKLWEYR